MRGAARRARPRGGGGRRPRYPPAQLKPLYAGLCRHLGTLVPSNRGGEIMREIRDVGADVGQRFGEEDETDRLAYPLPVWGQRDDRFTSHYSRAFVEVAQRRPEIPRLSPAQAEALDLLSDLAGELSFEMSFAPGDIQFVNNHVIYYAGTEFEDDAGSGHDRLLLRQWMAMPNSRALPAGHEVLWGSTAAGALRGGIGQTATGKVG